MNIPIIIGYTPIKTPNFGKRAKLILDSRGCPIVLVRTKDDLPEIERHIADEKEGLKKEKGKTPVDTEHVKVYTQTLNHLTKIKEEIEKNGESPEWLI